MYRESFLIPIFLVLDILFYRKVLEQTKNYDQKLITHNGLNNFFMYKILAKINKMLLPSFTKKRLDLSKANKWQMVIIGYRYFVTTRAL